MENISHLAPIFAVRNMDNSLAFYKKIGFQIGFLWQTPPTYAVLSAGERASIHLSLLDPEHHDRQVKSVLYVFVHNVDQIYALCQTEKLKILTPIGNRDYQMRDFELEDPDGHVLVFGKNLDHSESK